MFSPQQTNDTVTAVTRVPVQEPTAAADTDVTHAATNVAPPPASPRKERPDTAAQVAPADTSALLALPDTTLTAAPAVTLTQTPPPPPAWLDGLEPEERPGHAGHDQGVVAIIVLLMLGMSMSFNNIKRIWGNLTKRLWSTRVRESYDTDTGSEKRTIGLLLTEAVIFIAVLATAGLSLAFPDQFTNTLGTTLRMAGLVAAYFVFQYIAYWTVGYTFTDADGRQLWIQGFTASMTLLGIVLMIPGLAVLFYPDIAPQAVLVSGILYIIARIMFISKGFRIFYTNFASLVYFILYLCTLEIIPISILFFFARTVCTLSL